MRITSERDYYNVVKINYLLSFEVRPHFIQKEHR